jgi:23S rRNA pseudouridine2605 synthase
MPQEKKIVESERIAKVLARRGVASRRQAEELILNGRVRVNGQVLETPAVKVGPQDRIEVDGKNIPLEEKTRLWKYYKPIGLVCSARDEKGRTTVFDKLHETHPDLPRVISVGRLDLTSEGLLLLTNNGELARFLELPSTGWRRRYKVRVHGKVDVKKLEALKEGIEIEGVFYKGIEATLERQQGTNAWISVALIEGKNREIRRVMEHLGYGVTRLIRLSFGPFLLGALDPGQVEEIHEKMLKDQLGKKFQI